MVKGKNILEKMFLKKLSPVFTHTCDDVLTVAL